MPANWTNVENALQAQVVRATGLAAKHVVWADQKIGRPSVPFIELRLSEDVASGSPEHYKRDNPTPTTGDPNASPPVIGTELILGTRDDVEFTLYLQAHTAEVTGTASARALLVKVRNAFVADSYSEALYLSGVAVIDRSPVHNISEVLETKFEGRAALEIRCRVEDGHEETQTFIETVDMAVDFTE